MMREIWVAMEKRIMANVFILLSLIYFLKVVPLFAGKKYMKN